jgi:hypothetical protein
VQYLSKIKAAVKIFKEKKIPLSSQELIDIALKRDLVKVKGKTPKQTMNADILNENKRKNKNNLKQRFIKTANAKWRYVGD